MRAIVLGSGLNAFSAYFENIKVKSFDSCMNVVYETLDGHDRKFIWCQHEEEDFLIISGKFHYYEGFTYLELIAPLRYAIEQFGVTDIIVTSASGGLSDKSKIGQWTCINQIISIPAVNIDIPAYKANQVINKSAAKSDFLSLPQVTYAYHQGPSLGTLAEYKMLNYLAADLVGMSMLPEFTYLRNLTIKSQFLSIPVCNYYPFENVHEPSFEEVIEISASCLPLLVDLFKNYLSSSNSI